MENIELRKVLLKLGISANMKGFNYILQTIDFIDEPKHERMFIIYNKLAKINDTTPSAVERAIRHALEQSYKNNNIIQKIYKNKPHNTQFIYDLIFNFDIFIETISKENDND